MFSMVVLLSTTSSQSALLRDRRYPSTFATRGLDAISVGKDSVEAFLSRSPQPLSFLRQKMAVKRLFISEASLVRMS
jgi:hypothetical protein